MNHRIEEAGCFARRRARLSELAWAASRALDAEGREAMAVLRLLANWRSDPSSLGRYGRTIVLDGVVPWVPLRSGKVQMEPCDAAGVGRQNVRTGNGACGCILQIEGRWWRAFDIEGRELDVGTWPHPLGWEYRCRGAWRGDRLRTVTLRRATLEGGELRLRHGAWTYVLRAAFAREDPVEGALLGQPGERFTFCHLHGRGVPLRVVARQPAPFIERKGSGLWQHLARLLPDGLFARAVAGVGHVQGARRDLERSPGRCGSLLADASGGLLCALAEAVAQGSVPGAVRGLRVLQELEGLAARPRLVGRAMARTVPPGVLAEWLAGADGVSVPAQDRRKGCRLLG